MLLHALYERLCTVPLNRLPCYGALEVIVTLLLLLLFNNNVFVKSSCRGVSINDSVSVDLGIRTSGAIGNNELVVTRN